MGRVRLFLIWGREEGCVQGSGWRCGLGGLPAPLAVLRAGGMHSALLLLQALQKWQFVLFFFKAFLFLNLFILFI